MGDDMGETIGEGSRFAHSWLLLPGIPSMIADDKVDSSGDVNDDDGDEGEHGDHDGVALESGDAVDRVVVPEERPDVFNLRPLCKELQSKVATLPILCWL
jgi:hypothetical protein